MKPTFSIIVALYNQRAYLAELMNALGQQTFQDFEVHLCDDGSTDGTAEEVLTNIDAMPIPVYYHRNKKNTRSYAKTMNLGVAKAQGKYLVFIAGDSFPDQDYLEILADYAAEDRMVCGVRVQIAEVEGKMQGVDLDWRLKKEHIPTFPAILASAPWQLMTGNGLCVPTAAMRLYGPWSEDFVGYGGEDNELVARLYHKGYVCWSVPDLRLYHHWHKATALHKESEKKATSAIKAYAK